MNSEDFTKVLEWNIISQLSEIPDLPEKESAELAQDITNLVSDYMHRSDKSLVKEFENYIKSGGESSDNFKLCRKFYSSEEELSEMNNCAVEGDRAYRQYCDGVKLKEAVETFTPFEIARAYYDNWRLKKKKSKEVTKYSYEEF